MTTIDLRTLEPRLENWACAQRFPGYGGPDIASAEGRCRQGSWRELRASSHLMLLNHKFAAALAKLRNAERVAADELEAIWEHVKAAI